MHSVQKCEDPIKWARTQRRIGNWVGLYLEGGSTFLQLKADHKDLTEMSRHKHLYFV